MADPFANLVVRSSLGEGLLVESWLAVDHLRKPCVVERLRTELASYKPVQRAFIEASEGARALEHPQVVRVLGTGRTDAGVQRVVEHHAGVRLSNILAKLGTGWSAPSAAFLLSLLDQVLTILVVAQNRGIVHGALLPEGVRIGSRGRVVVGDFVVVASVARALAEEARAIFGQRIPPEVSQTEADTRSDVFGVGALGAALLAHVDDDAPGWPEMAALFARACSVNPAFRFADCAEMQIELQNLAEREDLSLSGDLLEAYLLEAMTEEDRAADLAQPFDSMITTTDEAVGTSLEDAGPTAIAGPPLVSSGWTAAGPEAATVTPNGPDVSFADSTTLDDRADSAPIRELRSAAASDMGESDPPDDFRDDGPTKAPKEREPFTHRPYFAQTVGPAVTARHAPSRGEGARFLRRPSSSGTADTLLKTAPLPQVRVVSTLDSAPPLWILWALVATVTSLAAVVAWLLFEQF